MRLSRYWPVLAGMLVGVFCSDAFAQESGGSVTLQWTAPGDDSLTGTAAQYDIRYSLFPITPINFPFCSGPTGIPRPSGAGTLQSLTVHGLVPGFRYYFALKTADERNNWSGLSNVVAFAEPAVGVGDGPLTYAFRAPVPNPARSIARFGYEVPERTHVEVDIFDVQGRMVQRIANSELPPSAGLLTWDLRDQSGARVSVGVYLARAKLGNRVFTQRVLVAH